MAIFHKGVFDGQSCEKCDPLWCNLAKIVMYNNRAGGDRLTAKRVKQLVTTQE